MVQEKLHKVQEETLNHTIFFELIISLMYCNNDDILFIAHNESFYKPFNCHNIFFTIFNPNAVTMFKDERDSFDSSFILVYESQFFTTVEETK